MREGWPAVVQVVPDITANWAGVTSPGFARGIYDKRVVTKYKRNKQKIEKRETGTPLEKGH